MARTAISVRVKYPTSATSVVDGLGMIHQLVPGEPWLADDPLVENRPDLFQDDPVIAVRTSNGWVAISDL